MTPARWQQVKGILADALEHEDAATRAAEVDRACGGDTALRQEVASLLARQSVGLERFATGVGARLQQGSDAVTHTGRRLGAYELTGELGRGGMGTVYLARRADGRFEQQAAVKLLKRGTDTDEVLRRFRAERRILARLQHPNIARLLDGGETDDGLPFFVMEYVPGVPLTAYAREHDLSVEARLALFGKVCAAVQFAHQNLVVHRDLKPGNILVTAEGEPKLLDFGLARLLGPADDDTALEVTAEAVRRLTPAYASPEQVRGAVLTTASDMYSLGALLYELLTSQPPHRFSGPHPPPAELLRVVGEQEPPRLSLAAEANVRPRLRGDLDNIVGRAMHKDPAHRYVSVEAFAEDLRRHRENRPVHARPDTWGYRTVKFISRNRAGVVAGTLVFTALLTTSGVALWQAKRASRRFEDVSKLAHAVLFEFNDSIRDLPGSVPARKLLVTRALEYLQKLEREAGGDLALRREIAAAYIEVGDVQGRPFARSLGDTAGALISYRWAVHVVDTLPGDMASTTMRANAWESLAYLLANSAGRREEALQLEARVLKARRALAADAPRDPAALRALAKSDKMLGDTLLSGSMAVWDRPIETSEAEGVYLQALGLYERLHAQEPRQEQDAQGLASICYRLGNVHHILGMHRQNDPAHLAQGLAYHRRSVALCEEVLAACPSSGQARSNLADALTMKSGVQTLAGDPAGALADCRRGIEIFEQLAAYDGDKGSDAFACYCAALPERALGDLTGALEYLDRASGSFEAAAAADPTNLSAVAQLNQIFRLRTEICQQKGDVADAMESVRRWIQYAERLSASAPNDIAMHDELAHARVVAEEIKGTAKADVTPASL